MKKLQAVIHLHSYIHHRGLEQVKATNIFVEEEVEFGLWRMVEGVKEILDTIPSAEGTPKLVMWNTPFYDMKVLLFLVSASRYSLREAKVLSSSFL